MPIDREGLLAKAFSHYLVENMNAVEEIACDDDIDALEKRQRLMALGRSWFRTLAPIASGFVSELRQEDEERVRLARAPYTVHL